MLVKKNKLGKNIHVQNQIVQKVIPNFIILNLIGERNIIQFKAFIFNIELLVSILFPIFDELLKIPKINVFLSPLSGGMASEKFHWHIKKCFRFNYYRFILKYFLLETVCFLITLVHLYQLLIGFESSLMGWKSHMCWQEHSDWSKIVTFVCNLTEALWLVYHWHVEKQNCGEKHQLNWKAKRTFCQSSFFYSNWISQEQWHHHGVTVGE